MKLMPQEIEVWYLIPALRKQLAKALISDFKQSQKQVSQILGITESAVSQYLNEKRAYELKFNKHEIKEIRKTAEKIISDKENCNKHLYRLTVQLRGADAICAFHKKQDKSLPENCHICME